MALLFHLALAYRLIGGMRKKWSSFGSSVSNNPIIKTWETVLPRVIKQHSYMFRSSALWQ
jgi:hypothetical protein